MSTEQKVFGLKDLEKRIGKATIGETLRTWRLCEDLTQVEFAKQLGISVQNLCDIEKGRQRVSPEKAAEIAEIIGYSTKILVERAINEQLESAGIDYVAVLKAI